MSAAIHGHAKPSLSFRWTVHTRFSGPDDLLLSGILFVSRTDFHVSTEICADLLTVLTDARCGVFAWHLTIVRMDFAEAHYSRMIKAIFGYVSFQLERSS